MQYSESSTGDLCNSEKIGDWQPTRLDSRQLGDTQGVLGRKEPQEGTERSSLRLAGRNVHRREADRPRETRTEHERQHPTPCVRRLPQCLCMSSRRLKCRASRWTPVTRGRVGLRHTPRLFASQNQRHQELLAVQSPPQMASETLSSGLLLLAPSSLSMSSMSCMSCTCEELLPPF